MKNLYLLLFIFFINISANAQPLFNKADSLRGSLNENRDWFDILKYEIDVSPDIETKSISGFVSFFWWQ